MIKCLGHGGAERLLVNTVTAADTDRFHYEVAYVTRGQDALVPAISASGTPVYAFNASHDADLRWMASLRRLLVRGRYDIVHFHLPYPAALGQLVVASLRHADRPGVVYTEHSLWDSDPTAAGKRLVIRSLLRASIRRDARLITVSQSSYDSLPPALRRRATTVVHAIDLAQSDSLLVRRSELRAQARAELGVGPDELLFITVANLRPEKGYNVLLPATRSIVNDGIPIRIAAIGRGPLRDELAALHAELELGDRFRFLGQRDDVLTLLAGADAFVLASVREGIPVALMEATSVGLPIVASSVGGVPQVLQNEVDALLVPPGDVESLVGALKRLASDRELRERLGRQAKLRSTQFDMAETNRAIADVYGKAVRTH